MGRSFTGIFAGKHVHYGNMVSHSERKTRRTWKPNVHRKGFYSEVLGRELDIKVTTAAIRTFDKYGGMDRYLLRSPLHRLDYGLTRSLRLTMELRLLANPRLAHDLHLEDVLERMARPREVKRIGREIQDRQEWARETGHLGHGILKTPLPTGIVPKLEPISDQVQQKRWDRLKAQRNARDLDRMSVKAKGASEALRKKTVQGIFAPKNKARAAPLAAAWRARPKRASYKNPFTRPTKAPVAVQG